MNICLIYLGNPLPKYAKENFMYLRRTFPQEKIWLLSDNLDNLNFASSLEIGAWKCSNALSSWQALKESELDHNFRRGFYSHALGRFAALNEFMRVQPDESALHIESDVWIAPNFPFSEIRKINQEVAFPLERKNVAIPSTLFLKNSKSMEKLFEFMTTRIRKGFPPIDMFLLAEYIEQFPNRVHILPTFLADPSMFMSNLDHQTQIRLLKNAEKYHGVFDSSTWGQYFFGIDPRNTHGIKVLFHIQKSHVFDPSIPKVAILSDGCIELTSGLQKKYLYSMHIHSKNRRVFTSSSRKFIRKILVKSKRGKVVYSLTAFSIVEIFRFTFFIFLIKHFFKTTKNLFARF